MLLFKNCTIVFEFFTYWLQHYLLTDDTGGTQMKRNRKPSEKVLELQAEKVKKPSKASKSSKPKSKSLADKSNGNESGLYSDELSDE
ncbi:protein RBL [Trifolium repens]|jgi:COMPASS component SWD1|nr:protein RBL [Trifolium repens]